MNENEPGQGKEIQMAATEVVDAISTDDYIKSTIEAGDRVRRIIYFLSFASIISLIAFWNAFGKSWINDRFDTIYEADEHYNPDTSRELHRFNCPNYAADSVRIYDFLKGHEINTAAKLAAYKKIYTDLEENVYTVKVPILGIGFDINDLGIFCGGTFAFLFILLVLAIGREHDNLIITFNYSEKNGIIGKVYYYLAMGQMLADPPTPSAHKFKHNWVRKHIVKALFFIPLFCQGAIVANDLISYDNGKYLNSTSALLATIASCALFLFNLALVIASVRKEVDMDRLWRKYCKKVPAGEVQPGF